MKKTKLLTSIAALTLVLGLGACEVNVDVGGVDVGDVDVGVDVNPNDSSEDNTGENTSVEESTSESTTEGNTSEDSTTESTTEDNTSENTSEDNTSEESGSGNDSSEDGGGNDDDTRQDAAAARDILTAASAIQYLSWTSFHIEEFEEDEAQTTYLTAVESDDDDVYTAYGVIADFEIDEEERTLTKSVVYSNGGKYTYTPGGEPEYATAQDGTDPLDTLDEYTEAYEDADEYLSSLTAGTLDYYLKETDRGESELVVTIPTYNNSHDYNPELPEYFYTECVYIVDTTGAIVGLGYREEDFMGGIEMCYYIEEVSVATVAEKVAKADLSKYPAITNSQDYESIRKILEPLSEKTNLADAYSAIQLNIAYEDADEKNDTYYITKDTSGLIHGIYYAYNDDDDYIVQYISDGTKYIESVDDEGATYSTAPTETTYESLLASYSHAVTAANEILAKVESDTLAVDSYELFEGGIGYELEYTSDEGNFFAFETNYSYTLRDFDVVTYYDGDYDYAYEASVITADNVSTAFNTYFDGTNWGISDTEGSSRYHTNQSTGELEPHQANESGVCTVCGETVNISGLEYGDNDDGTCYVSKYTSEVNVNEVFVPATHGGKTVTAVGDPSTSSASNGAFYNNATLEFVGLPEGITQISPYAFRQATALTSIDIPSTVTSIETYGFYQCTALETINFAENSALVSLGTDVFNGDSALTSVVLPEGVTTLGDDTFQNCTSLASAYLPNSITTIGTRTFQACSSLTSVNLPTNLTEVPNYTFYNCTSLTENGVTLPDGITSLGNYAFSGAAITSLDFLPTSITSFGTQAFAGCTKLVTVVVPNTVVTLGERSFQNCTAITYIDFGAGVTAIPSYCCNSCSALKTIVVSENVASISSSSFNSVTLETIYFGGDQSTWSALSNTPSATTIYYSGEWEYVDGVATPIVA